MLTYSIQTVMGTILKTGKVANSFTAKNRLRTKAQLKYGSSIVINFK
jgi:hypothetical protein